MNKVIPIGGVGHERPRLVMPAVFMPQRGAIEELAHIEDKNIIISQDAPQTNEEMSKVLESLNIQYLVHFTQESYIDSIMAYGLMPRNKINTLPVQVAINDELRLDNRLDTSSLSIGFPNSSMFYACRKRVPLGIEWGVILFSRDLLIDKECLFCPTNAASNSIRFKNEIDLKGAAALETLYTGDRNGLMHGWPTDQQAEALVKEVIEPKYILEIKFDNKTLTDKYKLKYPTIDVSTDTTFFAPRGFVPPF